MTKPAVAVTGLTKMFPVPFQRRVIVAVRELNMRVEAGQVYGLLGPNGSGKSTTLKVILGLVRPTIGRTEIFGNDSRQVSSRQAVGFLPESPYFPKYLTAAETLRFHGKLCGMHGAKLERKVADLLALVGLTNEGNRRLRGFSKGMLQRIGLAQALVHEPRLVVLDEPTAGLDPAGSRDVQDLILDMKNRGITVLLSSHLLGQVQEVCDRIGILARGCLVREGTLDDLLGVENQTELVLEAPRPQLVEQIATLARESGVPIVQQRRPRRTLEQFFLEVTGDDRTDQ